ncbi:hydroxymethylglutaryl-CoA lyase [Brevibacterium album]|uniref:hydroxymethylglutaryl-CoA lyase n=1 Tax=Brevibacterium album TaxID=417948 RepID=UPI000419A186|nr:hydroxymethylglutaryl-CoA lyase [Brevibacterium album]
MAEILALTGPLDARTAPGVPAHRDGAGARASLAAEAGAAHAGSSPLPAAEAGAAGRSGHRVTVHEVGPRDGLQAEPGVLSTALKVEFCTALLAAGVTSLEVASFVHPRLVPQMADAAEVAGALAASYGTSSASAGGFRDGTRLLSLVPNLRGLDRALEAGARSVGVFASATESFAQANMGTTMQGSVDLARETARAAAEQGMGVRGYLSMCFGDPWEGAVAREQVVRACEQLLEAGCAQVVVSDTIGVAHAGQIEDVLDALAESGVAPDRVALHLHDTYGQALANVRTALELGIREFDASASGLGRCPFAPGATGNLATEDLLWMLHGLGWETGIDLPALAAASDAVDRALGRPSASSVKRALRNGAAAD